MPELIIRSVLLERGEIDSAARTVQATLSSEAPYERFNGEVEILSHDPGAVDLTRAKDGLPLLFAHDHAQPIGIVENVRLEDRKLRGKLRFGTSAKAAEVFNDVVDGILKNMSIGYRVNAFEQMDGGYMATQWQIFEASVVGVPADATVGIGRAHSTSIRGNNPMPDAATNDIQAQARAAVEAERRRVADISDLCDRYQLTNLRNALITDGASVDQANASVLEALAARDAEGTRTRAPRVSGGNDDNDPEFRIRGMADVLANRYGGLAPGDQARQFSGLRLTDMARQLLELRGVRTTGLGAPDLIERALHTTSDFSNLLSATGERILRQAYGAYAGGIRRIAKQSTAPDFRAKSKIMLGEAPSLEKVNEHGEFTRGTMAEAKESYSLATYGRIFGITRQALVNDDLGAFADMLNRFGRAAVEFESKFLVDLLASNPTMSDGVALFHTTHGNLAGTGAAISITTLGAARQAMRLQKGLDGVTPIDATPAYLLVPTTLETLAEQYLSALTPNDSSKVNPFAGRLELVVDPRLDAKSATAWYVAADPGLIDTIEYSYLENAQGPVIEMRPGFGVDGVEIKCRLDYGAGIIDHRGLYRNAGA